MQTIEKSPIPKEIKLVYGNITPIQHTLADEFSQYWERVRDAYLEPYHPEEGALTPIDVRVYALGHTMGRMQMRTQRALHVAKCMLNYTVDETKTALGRERSRRLAARHQRLNAGQFTPHIISRALYSISGLSLDGPHIKVGKQDRKTLARLVRMGYEQDLAP